MYNTFENVSFFLGANSKKGYCSLFNSIYSPEENGKHYILKGGPGTGKSTLMKKVAKKLESKGYFTEYGYCSADPSSLDMIFAPEINFSVVDGTSPHTLDPSLPGVTEFIVNLGEAWDTASLKNSKEIINKLTKGCSAEHKKAADFLCAAGKCEKEIAEAFLKTVDFEKVNIFVKRLCQRKIPDKGTNKKGREYKRFLSGITPDGIVVQYDTLNALCESIVTTEDSFSGLSPLIAEFIGEYAKEKGYDIIKCFCPLFPNTKPEHIIIPELKLCFFTENSYHYSLDDINGTVHTTRFCNKEELNKSKEKIKFLSECKKEFIDSAVKKMSVAKGLHDRLEKYYINATDFNIIDEKCDEILKSI